jgi:hypothetical protein
VGAFDFRVDCDIDGGLLAGDRQTLGDLSDEELFALMVALDEKGNTDLALDYWGEDWTDVYLRETDRLKQRCVAGDLFLVHLGEGRFWGSLEGGRLEELLVDSPWALGRGGLLLPTGKLMIVEAGSFSARRERAMEDPLAELSMKAGMYGVRLAYMSRRNARGVRGEYGREGYPSLLFQIGQVNDFAPVSAAKEGNFWREDAAWRSSWVRSDDLVEARVKRIEGEKAILTIEFPSGDGFAQASLGSRQVSVGDTVYLRLLEKRGGRWEAEFDTP